MFIIRKKIKNNYRTLVLCKTLSLIYLKSGGTLKKNIQPVNLHLKKGCSFDYSVTGLNKGGVYANFLYKSIPKVNFFLKNKLTVELENGFINMFLNKTSVYTLNSHEVNLQFKKKVVVIDSLSPNVGKVTHVGHFRSVVQGFYIRSIFMLSKSYILMNNHCGNWGSHAGLTAIYLKNQFSRNFFLIQDVRIFSKNYGKYFSVFDRYKSLNLVSKSSLKVLHQRNKGIYFLWKNLFIASVLHFKRVLKKLNFTYDLNLGEFFYSKSAGLLTSSGLFNFKLNTIKASLIVKNLTNNSLYNITLKTSKEVNSYLFFDIANMYFQTQYNGSDFFVYVTDGRQVLHFISAFQVFFKINTKLLFKKIHLTNILFGTICGSNKKPIKSRLGISKGSTLNSLINTKLRAYGFDLKTKLNGFFFKKGWITASLGYSDLKSNKFSNILNSNINLLKSYTEVTYLRFFLLKTKAFFTDKCLGLFVDLNLYVYLIKYLEESTYYLKLSFFKKNLTQLLNYIYTLSNISHKFFFKKKLMGYVRKNLLSFKESRFLTIKRAYVFGLLKYLEMFIVIP